MGSVGLHYPEHFIVMKSPPPSIPDCDQYFVQFQSVVTLEPLPAVCVVGLNPACWSVPEIPLSGSRRAV
jgi:hypothetical protein